MIDFFWRIKYFITSKLLPQKGARFYWLKLMFVLGMFGGFLGVLLVAGIITYFAFQVPDYRSLVNYNPWQITRVYSADGTVLAEYARQRRIYVPIENIPQDVVDTFLAAEDAGFFNHFGFDPIAIVRAFLVNVFTDRVQGASTITQQVAKTFLLSSERTYTRKIKELILSWRIEQALEKEEILELYLNQIYLGNGAYGVAAAADAYFSKTLDELNILERAMIAGLPKAPSRYDPIRNPREARFRRDVILRRMEAEGLIPSDKIQEYLSADLVVNPRSMASGELAPHFSEHVRRHISETYGDETLYTGGLNVFTTLDLEMQKAAEESVYHGVRELDRRHGYRGPVGRVGFGLNWQNRVDEEYRDWRSKRIIGYPAAVLETQNASGTTVIGLPGGQKGFIPMAAMRWAKEYIDENRTGPTPSKPSDVLEEGDIIFVKPLAQTPEFKNSDAFDEFKSADNLNDLYSLEQVPQAQGALVALDVETGAIKAMVGGIGDGTGFNRATQAVRQVGASFKPFVYSLALENGATPASIVLDAPVVLRSNEMNEAWKPHNYSEKVYGPSTLRLGLEKSRNLMTIRLARDLGISNIISYARKFGITADMNRDLSTALGSGSVNLLELTSAYAVFPNQGVRVKPYFIDFAQDSTGYIVESAYPECLKCMEGQATPHSLPPELNIAGERVTSPQIAYQMVSMLQGVVQRGTAWRARAIGRPLGAKTGTTNDYIDAWLMGFSPEYAVGVWVGFDKPAPMGKPETGSRAAGPIWVDFMKDALEDKPVSSFEIPEGITFVRIDAETGKLPTVNSKKTILEAFRSGTEPTEEAGSLPQPKVSPQGGSETTYDGIY